MHLLFQVEAYPISGKYIPSFGSVQDPNDGFLNESAALYAWCLLFFWGVEVGYLFHLMTENYPGRVCLRLFPREVFPDVQACYS